MTLVPRRGGCGVRRVASKAAKRVASKAANRVASKDAEPEATWILQNMRAAVRLLLRGYPATRGALMRPPYQMSGYDCWLFLVYVLGDGPVPSVPDLDRGLKAWMADVRRWAARGGRAGPLSDTRAYGVFDCNKTSVTAGELPSISCN